MVDTGLKSIHAQVTHNTYLDNKEAVELFKEPENLEGEKFHYGKLVCKSGDNKYFNFNWLVFI